MAVLLSSQLSFARSPRGLFAELLPQLVPGWSTYAEGVLWCGEQRAHLQRLAAAQVGTDKLISLTVDDVLNGQPPADFVERMRAAQIMQADFDRGTAVLDKVETTIVDSRDAAVRASADELYRALDARLQAVVRDARTLSLGAVQDGDAAIEQGLAGPWAQFIELRGQHNNIRAAQQRLAHDLETSTTELDTFGAFRNYTRDFPDWHLWRRSGPTRSQGFGSSASDRSVETVHAAPPWPADQASRFRWLVDHQDVDVWVPTDRQLEDAIDSARRTVVPLTPQRIRSLETEARTIAAQQPEGERADFYNSLR